MPFVVMTPYVLPGPPENQRRPSEPSAIWFAPPVPGNSVMVPAGVTRARLDTPGSVNHTLPSRPSVSSVAFPKRLGARKNCIVWSLGLIRPTAVAPQSMPVLQPLFVSVNHKFRSGPVMMSHGKPRVVLVSGYSTMLPAVSTRPIRWQLGSVDHIALSGAQ